jgi:hypothetical protein
MYTVQDGDGAESAPATVTVFGPALNEAPTARDQTIHVTVGRSENLVLDVGDPDGDPLTLIDVSDPSGVIGDRVGLSLVIVATTEGTFQVTYRVSDGTAPSRVATVTINATAAKGPPTTPEPTPTEPPTPGPPTPGPPTPGPPTPGPP